MRSRLISLLVGILLTSGAAVAVASPAGRGAIGLETDHGPARVAALNPAGHCVMLPETSDIIRHPEKHPNWHVIGGQCP